MDADLGDGSPLGGAATSASRRRLVGADSAGPVPTRLAEASRALGGNTSTAEQYAFTGVACVLDQHRRRLSKVDDDEADDSCDSGETPQAAPTRLRFANNDATRLAAGGSDGRVSVSLVWPAPASVLCLLAGHVGPVSDLAWSSDNDLLLSASSGDGTARVWSVVKATCLRQFPAEPAPGQPLFAAEFAPSNNNLFLVAGGRDDSAGQLRSVNLSTGLCQATLRLPARVTCLTFGCQPDELWLGDSAGCLRRCSLDSLTGRLAHLASVLTPSNSPTIPAAAVASARSRSWLSREARDPCLLVCTAGAEVLLYGLGPLALRRRLPVPRPARAAFCPLMSFRPGACVVCASADGSVYIVDVSRDTRPVVNQLRGHDGPVTDVAFNYDESLLASADAGGTVIVWRRA